MAKYDVKRACGHEETVVLFGKHTKRDWLLENVEPNKLCTECYKLELARQIELENEEADKLSKEMELPQLIGSEKQVAWAQTIRIKLLETCQEVINDRFGNEPKAQMAFQSILSQEKASWWIDHRAMEVWDAIHVIKEEMSKIEEAVKVQRPSNLDALAEATVRPEQVVTETVAEVRIAENVLQVIFPEKRDDFREIIKGLKMKWEGGRWERKIGLRQGPIEDRAAEVGHALLANGISVRMFDLAIRDKAITADYEPETTRWIVRATGKYQGWFNISWARDEDYYLVAKKIPGAKYDKPEIVVPPESFEELLDFAKMYGFSLSECAQELAEQAREVKMKSLVVEVREYENQSDTAVKPMTKPPILDVPSEVSIADEFKD